MDGETVTVIVSIVALICIFMPFLSLIYQSIREWWNRRKPKAPPPQTYNWLDNYGSGPKDKDDDD